MPFICDHCVYTMEEDRPCPWCGGPVHPTGAKSAPTTTEPIRDPTSFEPAAPQTDLKALVPFVFLLVIAVAIMAAAPAIQKQFETAPLPAEIQSDGMLVAVDFSAGWCGPCRALKPTMQQLQGDYWGKVKILTVDIDQRPDLATRHGVRGIPCVVLFDKTGKEAGRRVGARSIAEYVGWFNNELAK